MFYNSKNFLKKIYASKNFKREMCIHANTFIPTNKFGNTKTVEELYYENKNGKNIGKIWSYDVDKYRYELVNYQILKNEKKKIMIDVILEDETSIKCTKDQKILNNISKKYVKANNIKNKMTTPFLRQLKMPSWCVCENIRNENILALKKKTIKNEKFDSFKIIVEKNNNFAVVTELIKNVECGIILKDSS